MDGILRATTVLTLIALVFHGPLPTWASDEASIEGTVEVPCDPSRVSDVVSVQVRPVSGGSAAAAAVDPASGKFLVSGLTPGEYELIAIGAEGKSLSPEPKPFLVRAGVNPVILSLQPPGCGDQDSQDDGKKGGLKDWHLTLIFFGVVGVLILVLSSDEGPASPF